MPLRDFRSEVDPDLSDAPELADLRRYWESKRRGGLVPLRSAIDPAELKAHLGTLFIVEPLPGMEDFRYRLMGATLVRLQGRDYTNRTVTEALAGQDPALQRSIIAAYRKVLVEATVIRVRGTLVWVGKEFVRFDSLHLPLSTGGDEPNLILGKQLIGASGSRDS